MTSMSTTVSLSDNAHPLIARMGGADREVPVVSLSDRTVALDIHIARVPDPVAWLREAATDLLVLADQLEQRRADQ